MTSAVERIAVTSCLACPYSRLATVAVFLEFAEGEAAQDPTASPGICAHPRQQARREALDDRQLLLRRRAHGDGYTPPTKGTPIANRRTLPETCPLRTASVVLEATPTVEVSR